LWERQVRSTAALDEDAPEDLKTDLGETRSRGTRGNINSNGRRYRLFLLGSKDSPAADAVAELETGAPLPLELADCDGGEGPLTAVRALEMYFPL
jgi:hypothetical protein